jgi:enoyl-CoA hydratase/carnithine racemase
MSIYHLSDKTIAYLHGTCAGAGIEIPAFASKIIVDESVNIFLPEIAMGLIPGAGGTVSIPRRIGRQRTAYLAVTGNSISSETAMKWGLVDEISGAEF